MALELKVIVHSPEQNTSVYAILRDGEEVLRITDNEEKGLMEGGLVLTPDVYSGLTIQMPDPDAHWG